MFGPPCMHVLRIKGFPFWTNTQKKKPKTKQRDFSKSPGSWAINRELTQFTAHIPNQLHFLISPIHTSGPASVSLRVIVSAAIFGLPNSAVSHLAVDTPAPEPALEPTGCLHAQLCSHGGQHFSNLLFAVQSAAAAAAAETCAHTWLYPAADCDVSPLFSDVALFYYASFCILMGWSGSSNSLYAWALLHYCTRRGAVDFFGFIFFAPPSLHSCVSLPGSSPRSEPQFSPDSQGTTAPQTSTTDPTDT